MTRSTRLARCDSLKEPHSPYVSHQMGHSSPETTLRYYARWIPDTKSRWFGTKSGTKGDFDDERSAQVVGSTWSRREDLNLRPADYESSQGKAEKTEQNQERQKRRKSKDYA